MNTPAIAQIELLLPPLLAAQRGSWEQGTACQALLEAHELLQNLGSKDNESESSRLYPLIYGLCHDAILRASTDGRLATRVNSDDEGHGDGGAVDPACIGQAVLHVVADMGDEAEEKTAWAKAAGKMLRYVMEDAPRVASDSAISKDGVISHLTMKKQIWSDAMYMLPPFLASSALSSHQTLYPAIQLLESAFDQILDMAGILQRPDTKLLAHIFDGETHSFLPPQRSMNGVLAWGVGNGWACGGIIRILRMLHAALHDTAWREWLIADAGGSRRVERSYELLLTTINACLVHIRPDGLFHNIIDDPTSFVETNLSQMLASAIFRVLSLDRANTGHLYLPRLDTVTKDRYHTVAEEMWRAARGKVDRHGFVKDVCGSPRFDRPGTAVEGQAWGILMEVAKSSYNHGFV